MTQTDIKYLAEYENNFRTAINHNYTRNIPVKEIDKMLQIYERITRKKYVLCKHCSTSILNFIKVVGRMYFEAKEEMEITIEKKRTNGKVRKSK